MAYITKPMALDETLQDVVTAIQGITQGGMIVATNNVGSSTQPVYINGGVPTASDQAFIVTGKIFFVDGATGSDSNDGSQAHPFATIQKAVNSCGTIENNPASRNWSSPGDRIYINTASTYAPFRVIGKRIDFNAIDSSAGALKISTSSATLFGAIDIAWGSYVVFNCAVDVTYTNTSRGAISINDCYCRFTQAVTVVSSGVGIGVSMRGHLFADGQTITVTAGTGGTRAALHANDGSDVSFYQSPLVINGGEYGVLVENSRANLTDITIASAVSKGLAVTNGILFYRAATNNSTTKKTINRQGIINGKSIITTGTPTVNSTYVTSVSARWLKSGNMVELRINELTTTAGIAWKSLLSGLPIPLQGTGVNNVCFETPVSRSGASVGVAAGRITNSGELMITETPSALTNVDISLSYLTND